MERLVESFLDPKLAKLALNKRPDDGRRVHPELLLGVLGEDGELGEVVPLLRLL